MKLSEKLLNSGAEDIAAVRALEARVAELEAENQELRQGLLRQPTFDNIERKPTSSLPPEKFQIVVQCPSCGIFVPQSQIKH